MMDFTERRLKVPDRYRAAMSDRTRIRWIASLAGALAVAAGAASAGALDRPECIVPAKPGGGFDLTCKLAQRALQGAGLIAEPMRISYLPGGIGAVAYNAVVTQRPDSAGTIVAFSGGSLLNLAQGKFGRHDENDVRWLAAVGTDYGAVIVAQNSPYQSLRQVLAAVKADPNKVVFGSGGTVGSQDWMKAALIARVAGVSPKSIRFVAFEGGGEATRALEGGHIQVLTGDVAETAQHIKAGTRLRMLAVLSEQRLAGPLADVPTAREQGADVVWPIMRGFYVGPKVSDADFKTWSDALAKAMATPAFDRLRSEHGLYPLALTGAEVDIRVKQQVLAYRKLADEFGLAARR
jgi:putative tricarboxylic transport membrane protein